MPQHDFDITSLDANTGLTFRAAVNAALQALASSSSGSSAPVTTYAFQLWADTSNDLLKMRNASNSAWISVCVLSTGRPVYIPSVISSSELGYLDGVTSSIQTQIDSKQATLVSGTNIKTVAGTSILGSGDITISSFPSGTALVFVQTAAPTGWTKSTTHDNKALRIVSGTASYGGSTPFTSVFASRTPSGSVYISGGSVNGYTLGINEMPSHSHVMAHGTSTSTSGTPGGYWGIFNPAYDQSSTSSTGGSSSHSHAFTAPSGSFSGSAMDFNIAYIDAIIATKN